MHMFCVSSNFRLSGEHSFLVNLFSNNKQYAPHPDTGSFIIVTLKVLVTTIDAQWEGMGDVGSARYEPAQLPPCSTIRVLSYSN